jgi:uncharacterized membrane protein
VIDPISAMAAVSAVVGMIKKATETVDDVASLGPLIGKYFDAKQQATKAVRETKKQGGSNMGKAIEIELALKSQRDFEEQLKGLFFSTNNMDVWNSIMKRVAEMNAEDKAEDERERVRLLKAKKRQRELNDIFLGIGIIVIMLIGAGWTVLEFVDYCQTAQCGK